MSDEFLSAMAHTMTRSRLENAGWDDCVLDEVISPGRFKVRLPSGALVTPDFAGASFNPVVGQTVSLSRINGIFTIRGDSGYE